MGVKHNALVLAGGMAGLMAVARGLTPVKQISSTPPSMVKIEVWKSDVAIASADPFAGSAATQMYFPKEFVHEYSQGAQPLYSCPTGIAEKDLMPNGVPHQRSNFVRVQPTTSAAGDEAMAKQMVLLIRSEDLPVRPFVCPSGVAEDQPTTRYNFINVWPATTRAAPGEHP